MLNYLSRGLSMLCLQQTTPIEPLNKSFPKLWWIGGLYKIYYTKAMVVTVMSLKLQDLHKGHLNNTPTQQESSERNQEDKLNLAYLQTERQTKIFTSIHEWN